MIMGSKKSLQDIAPPSPSPAPPSPKVSADSRLASESRPLGAVDAPIITFALFASPSFRPYGKTRKHRLLIVPLYGLLVVYAKCFMFRRTTFRIYITPRKSRCRSFACDGLDR